MYVEDPAKLYACFRCGVIGGDVKYNDEDIATCGECGEVSLVTFIQALDILNDMYLGGQLGNNYEDDSLEYEIEIEEDDDLEQT